jgi:branched-chain amino acid transport system substrate-binding protein
MKSNLGRIAACAATLSAAFATTPSHAQVSDDTVKIGVLTDQTGLYADATGPGSVEAVRIAIADFGGKVAGKSIAMIDADHQNKADVGAAIARRWYEQENVDVIVDFANSAVAFAVLELSKQKNKAMLVSSAGSSDLTGKACSPNSVQWTYNTYASPTAPRARSSRKAQSGTSSPSTTRSTCAAQRRGEPSARRHGQGNAPSPQQHGLLIPCQAPGQNANVVAFANTGSDLPIRSASQEFGLAGKQKLVAFRANQRHSRNRPPRPGDCNSPPPIGTLTTRPAICGPLARPKRPTMVQTGLYSAVTNISRRSKSGTDDGLRSLPR